MDVGHKSLSPGMEDRREAKFRSQMAGISGELFEGVRYGVEEIIIEQSLIKADHLVELMGQGEDEVEVGSWQQQGLLGFAS